MIKILLSGLISSCYKIAFYIGHKGKKRVTMFSGGRYSIQQKQAEEDLNWLKKLLLLIKDIST